MADGLIDDLPLVVIAGPTASGKTGLSIEVAEEFNGEIICADSRTIYKGMDIGTAKPTREQQARVPHWGLDLVLPDQVFTVADFKRYANEKIADIRERGKLPFLVGGSGLYIDAIIFDYKFGTKHNQEERARLESMTLEELHSYCNKNNIELPENLYNKRYVIRAIERQGQTLGRNRQPIQNAIIIGIHTERQALRHRIEKRANVIFESGAVEEARSLAGRFGWESEAMTGNVYRLIREYDNGVLTREELIEKFTTLDWRLAKRQLTWFRRNPYIEWMTLSQAHDFLRGKFASL